MLSPTGCGRGCFIGFFFFFLASPRGMPDLCSPNPCRLQWKCGDVAPGPWGRSPYRILVMGEGVEFRGGALAGAGVLLRRRTAGLRRSLCARPTAAAILDHVGPALPHTPCELRCRHGRPVGTGSSGLKAGGGGGGGELLCAHRPVIQ